MFDEGRKPVPVFAAVAQEIKRGEKIFGLTVSLMHFNDQSIDRVILTPDELSVIAGTNEVSCAETENGETALEAYIISEKNKTDKDHHALIGLVKQPDNTVQLFDVPRLGSDTVRVPAERGWRLLENGQAKKFVVDPQKTHNLRITKQLGYSGGTYTYFVLPTA